MMTEKKKEIAARELCRIRQIDPDYVEEYNGHNSGTYGISAWRKAVAEIEKYEAIESAIAFALASDA